MNEYLSRLAKNDEEKRLLARMIELAEKAARGEGGRSDFLDLRQQELAMAVAVNTSTTAWYFDGGYEEAERQRWVLYPDWEVQGDVGIVCLQISHKVFNEQAIGHRDYLGAVLNLGIKREKLGDIVVQNETAFMFIDENLAAFVCQQLTRVKHSSVSVELINWEESLYQPPNPQTLQVNLASLRLDAAIAAAFNLSRTDASVLIEGQKVKFNQIEISKGSTPVNTGDLISVRGKGRFRIEEVGGISRKGRYHVQISRW